MSTFVETARRWALPALLAALAVPIAAAGITGKVDAAPPSSSQPKAKASPAAPPSYQLRCWQYGRLILEEVTRDIPSESALDVMRLHDRNGGQVLLMETNNATCLVKTAPPAPPKSIAR